MSCPWGHEKESKVFCFECHEELLHNPILLPGDIAQFAELVKLRGLEEDQKPRSREKIAGRVVLFHEVIARGLEVLREEANQAGQR